MTQIEEQLELLLRGEGLGPDVHVADVISKNNDVFIPVVKQSVCYIVCGIVFNDQGEVLMMQEAKVSCRGMWYLPAGRMEENESIIEGVKREVLEETGMVFEPTTLLSVEIASGFWYRFTLTGRVVGGNIKTLEQQDEESLQARWCSMDTIKSNKSEFPLRSGDIIPLLDIALQYRSGTENHPDILPSNLPHTQLLLRAVFVHVDKNSSETKVIYGKTPSWHLPTATISTRDPSLQYTLFRLVSNIFGHCKFSPNILGVLSVEHCGKPAQTCDGFCLNVLATLGDKDGRLPDIDNGKFNWIVLNGDVKSAFLNRLEPCRNLPLLLLR